MGTNGQIGLVPKAKMNKILLSKACIRERTRINSSSLICYSHNLDLDFGGDSR